MENTGQSSHSRHEALAPFSRDHYVGLVQARHLVRASEGEAQERHEAIRAFMAAWHNEILVHFQDEERLLLSLLEEADRERMLAEHRQLVERAAELEAQQKQEMPDGRLLEETGNLLREHIRWEERDVFNRLQNNSDEEILAELQVSTTKVEESRDRRGSGPKGGTE